MAQPSPEQPHLGPWIEHRRIAGWVLLFGPGLAGVLWLAVGLLARGVPGLQLAAGPPLLMALVLLGVRRRLGARIKAAQSPADPPRVTRRLTFGLGLAGLVVGGLVFVFGPRAPRVLALDGSLLPWLTVTVVGGLTVLGGLVLALFARFYGTTDREVLPEAPGLANWMRAGSWCALLTGAALMSDALYANASSFLHLAAHRVGAGVLAVCVLELCLRGLGRKPVAVDPTANLFSLRLIASRWNPISSFFGTLTEAFGIDLRGTWALGFIQRSLPPLGLGLVLLAWLGSAFTLVDMDEVGVLETFGQPASGEPLEPGLDLHWPWPIQTVQRVAVGRVRSIPMGFFGARKGASLLWTKAHAKEEYHLLIGDGEDLVTVNALLHYRISDPRLYLYNSADSDGELAVIADRALMRATVGHTLEQVLSENLTRLTEFVERQVQADADALGLGLEVVDFTLLGLHPPMNVAREYQAVISAQIEVDTVVYGAEADRERALPGARARGRLTRGAAKAWASQRTAVARGEAQGFEAQVKASHSAPDLFRFRRLLEAREKQLAGQSFVVLDERFEAEGAVIRALGSPRKEGQ
jgi:regulator of protease activity HflC (stomatin/prohibitin superfamily)